MLNFVPRQPLRALLGLGGVAGLGFAFMRPPAERDVGAMPPVYAVPAERVEVRQMGAGQTLGEVLADFTDPTEQQALLLAFQEQASARRMRVGTEINLRYRESDSWLRGVDVLLNPDSTVRLTRGELGWTSRIVTTPTWTDTLFAVGQIEDVLWNAVVESRALEQVPVKDRALLLHHLDQVFQWQVDFSRQIQRGDRYRFVFEREVRPDGSMRSGHLISAELVNAGTYFHAIWFDPEGDGSGSYFDMEGKSVRRAFLLKPLEFRRISSRYTNSRFHPILKTWRAHRGIDYAASSGTEIMATADGVVARRGAIGALGNAVEIRHPNGYVTRYGHMSRFHADVRVGTRVRQGQVIGYVGATGLATAPHLHYELWKNGRPVDPLGEQMPPGDPVPDDQRARWDAERQTRMALLERMPHHRLAGVTNAPLGEGVAEEE
jgi:murein DD-endopeptidase MepM/ murein hydrolase activator NlpD